jgi:carbon-monoxide dehydrogenase small subunit
MDMKETTKLEPDIFPKEQKSITVNGIKKIVTKPDAAPLVEVLREECQLTGTKVSCGIGRCGACSVLMDGRLVNSCMTMVYQAFDKQITTIEGLAVKELDCCQQAFLQEGGFQCGYCTPGMIIALKALFLENKEASDEEILEGVSGNLCRCTGYGGIIRAARRVREELKETHG